jgi:hypothetical protein
MFRGWFVRKYMCVHVYVHEQKGCITVYPNPAAASVGVNTKCLETWKNYTHMHVFQREL